MAVTHMHTVCCVLIATPPQDILLQPEAREGVAERIEAGYAEQGPVGAADHRAELRKAREEKKESRKNKQQAKRSSEEGQEQPPPPPKKAKAAAVPALFSGADIIAMAKRILAGMDKSAKGPSIEKNHGIKTKGEDGKRIHQVRHGNKALLQVVETQFGPKSLLIAHALLELHVLGFGKSDLEQGKKILLTQIRDESWKQIA